MPVSNEAKQSSAMAALHDLDAAHTGALCVCLGCSGVAAKLSHVVLTMLLIVDSFGVILHSYSTWALLTCHVCRHAQTRRSVCLPVSLCVSHASTYASGTEVEA